MPQRSARSTPKPMIRRVNTSITTMTQWLRRSIDSQRNRSTLHKLSFRCPIKLSQDGPSGITAFELDDCVDEFLRRSFRAGAPMTSRREKPPVFAFLECRVESEQGPRLQDDRELRDSACWHEQRSKTQDEAIERI